MFDKTDREKSTTIILLSVPVFMLGAYIYYFSQTQWIGLIIIAVSVLMAAQAFRFFVKAQAKDAETPTETPTIVTPPTKDEPPRQITHISNLEKEIRKKRGE